MHAVIRCVKVLSSALSAYPVITAKFRQGLIYVLLSDTDRHELSREFGIKHGCEANQRGVTFPEMIRNHKIDAESGLFLGGDCAGIWSNGESLWVQVNGVRQLAEKALLALSDWRANNPRAEGRIHAPNWRVLTVVRALALAAGLADPMIAEDKAENQAVA